MRTTAQELGVDSIAGQVPLHSAQEVRSDPEGVTAEAAARVASQVAGWWLHVDLDVLDGHEFAACGAAHDPSMPQGLTWSQLTTVTWIALRSTACQGWSIAVYNPDLDPHGDEARRIVAYGHEATGNICMQPPDPLPGGSRYEAKSVVDHSCAFINAWLQGIQSRRLMSFSRPSATFSIGDCPSDAYSTQFCSSRMPIR